VDLPFVLIGHSKLFTRANASSLRPFLAHVRENSDRFRFGTFSDIDFDALDGHSNRRCSKVMVGQST
jgi:hypothetical protein